jgi:hypothetical protein
VFEIEDRYTSILKLNKLKRNNSGTFVCFTSNQPEAFIKFELSVKRIIIVYFFYFIAKFNNAYILKFRFI